MFEKNLLVFFKTGKIPTHSTICPLLNFRVNVEWISNCCCDLLPKYLVRFTFQLNVVVYTYYI